MEEECRGHGVGGEHISHTLCKGDSHCTARGVGVLNIWHQTQRKKHVWFKVNDFRKNLHSQHQYQCVSEETLNGLSAPTVRRHANDVTCRWFVCIVMNYEKLSVMTTLFAPQTPDCDQHSLLDRAASQWPSAVAGQGPHTDGLSQHPLFQRVIGTAHFSETLHLICTGQLKLLSVIIRK